MARIGPAGWPDWLGEQVRGQCYLPLASGCCQEARGGEDGLPRDWQCPSC